MSAPPSSSSSAGCWHQPHHSCGPYTGPTEPTPTPPTIHPEWKKHADQDTQQYAKMAPIVQQIFQAVEKDADGYHRLEHLCTEFGARISGSSVLDRSIAWAESAMRADGLENVHTEEVMVPNWIRGTAQCEIQIFATESDYANSMPPERRIPIEVLAVGLSVGTVPIEEAREIHSIAEAARATPATGIAAASVHPNPSHVRTAPLLVVSSFDELDSLVASDPSIARGKLILFNNRFINYSLNVPYRGYGAARAEAVGAIGAIVRSVTPVSLYTPHTGSMMQANVPIVCCTIEDAEVMARLYARGKHLVCSLYSSCFLGPDVPSRNLICELRGRSLPDESVLLAAHIDSWDVGQGAHDDGQGCCVAWDVVRVLLKNGLRPMRTIRVVLFTDEEVMSRGAEAYFEKHKHQLGQVQAVMETDLGAYTATGFGFTGNVESRSLLSELLKLLTPYGADELGTSGPGVDVRPMADAGVPALLLSFNKEWTFNDYFAFHHTQADTFDKIDPQMMKQNTQIFAILAYLLADIPHRLPHSLPVGAPAADTPNSSQPETDQSEESQQ